MNDIRVAVVGAGNMGANHARVLASLKGVQLAYVVDADGARAQSVAEKYGATALTDIADLPGRVEAVTLATTSITHAEVGGYLLRHGLPCLIEKPLAVNRAECDSLIAAAASAGVPVAVGHVERFNPAIQKTSEILKGRAIQAIEARRLNPGSARILDTDVVIDLMVHDLDVVLALMGGMPTGITARGLARNKPGVADHATALLDFGNRSLATVTASRITQTKVRELLIQCDAGMVTVNYITQEVHVTRSLGWDRGPGEWPEQNSSSLDLALEKVFIRQAEPLALELGTFCTAVRLGTPEGAGISPEEALRALEVVWTIQQQIAAEAA